MFHLLLATVILLVVALFFLVRRQLSDVHSAARTGSIDSLTSILRQRPDMLYARNAAGETPMHQAASYGELRALKLIVELGGDVNVCTPEGVTPLHLAAAAGKSEVVQYLLELGADPNRAESTGITPHMAATMRGHSDVVLLLAQAGARESTASLPGDSTPHPDMLAATARARETHDIMVQLFKAHTGTTMVKVPFVTDAGMRERVWCELLGIADSTMQVRLRTYPVSQREPVSMTQEFPLADLEDWQIELPDGTVRGGFSFGVMVARQRRTTGPLPDALEDQVARYIDLKS